MSFWQKTDQDISIPFGKVPGPESKVSLRNYPFIFLPELASSRLNLSRKGMLVCVLQLLSHGQLFLSYKESGGNNSWPASYAIPVRPNRTVTNRFLVDTNILITTDRR